MVGRAGRVGDLYAAALAYGIVVEVDIGAFVEAVVRGLLGWWGDVVVDVCEAVIVSICLYGGVYIVLTASGETPRPAVEASCWIEQAIY